jgi:aminopeptidase N
MQVSEKDHTFSFPLDKKPAMFRFDPENWILKTVSLNVPKHMLLHQLANDRSVMGRIAAAQALAKVGGSDVVDALEKAVAGKNFWGVSVEAATLLGTMGTTSAREALKRAATHKNAKVRRSVVSALGNFKDESVGELLAGIVGGGTEKSVFVLADAAAALGKTKSPKAFDTLKGALKITSWNETVRVGVLNGLAELGDERGIDLAGEYAQGGQPWHARPAAIAALGKLGAKVSKAVDSLHSLADSDEAEQFTLRMAIVGALGEAKQKDSVPYLRRIHNAATDGRIKRAVDQTIEKLAGGSDKPEASVEELKGKVEKLEGQVRDLTEKLGAPAKDAKAS